MRHFLIPKLEVIASWFGFQCSLCTSWDHYNPVFFFPSWIIRSLKAVSYSPLNSPHDLLMCSDSIFEMSELWVCIYLLHHASKGSQFCTPYFIFATSLCFCAYLTMWIKTSCYLQAKMQAPWHGPQILPNHVPAHRPRAAFLVLVAGQMEFLWGFPNLLWRLLPCAVACAVFSSGTPSLAVSACLLLLGLF